MICFDDKFRKRAVGKAVISVEIRDSVSLLGLGLLLLALALLLVTLDRSLLDVDRDVSRARIGDRLVHRNLNQELPVRGQSGLDGVVLDVARQLDPSLELGFVVRVVLGSLCLGLHNQVVITNLHVNLLRLVLGHIEGHLQVAILGASGLHSAHAQVLNQTVLVVADGFVDVLHDTLELAESVVKGVGNRPIIVQVTVNADRLAHV